MTHTHLTQDELLAALVDPADLPPAVRGHLKSCRECADELGELQVSLESMAQTASDSVKVPPRRFSFAQDQAARARPPHMGWWVSWAAGMAAAAVLLMVLLPQIAPAPEFDPGPDLAAREEGAPEDQTLIYWQPEEAFSPFQRFVLSSDENSLDEDFLDFVAPSADEETTHLNTGRQSC